MRFIIALRSSSLLEHNSVTLENFMLGGFLPFYLWADRKPVLTLFLCGTLADVLLSELTALPYRPQVFWFYPQLASCYLFHPWWTKGHTIFCESQSDNTYLCCPVHTVWMMEVNPLLQRKSHSQIVLCHGCNNLPHCTPCPSLNLEVGTWISHAYHRRAQRTGKFWLWKASKFRCGCIWHGPGRFTCVQSTCHLPTQTTTTYQSRRNSPIQCIGILLRW